MSGRRPLAIVAGIAVVIVIAGIALWRGAPPPPPPLTAAQREAAAAEMVSGLHISTSVSDSTLAASKALVDFMMQNDTRLVLVRIVDVLDLEIRIETSQTIAFDAPPSFCLVGPDSAPDDGGYTSPCWGAPDLGGLIVAQLPTDPAGHPTFPGGDGSVLSATVERGGRRCEYAPGDWQLVIKGNPLIDGMPAGDRELAKVDFDVPWMNAEPLPFLEVRTVAYCGLANRIYREQGEPEIVTPAPSG